MTDIKVLYYSFFLLFAIGFSFIINKLFLRAYYNFGSTQVQKGGADQVRWANIPKPLLGGFSFYLLFLFSISVYSILFDNSFLNKAVIGILLSCSFGFLLGWADDGYGTNPILKFVGQFICANILTGTGLIIPLSDIVMIDYMFTVFWIIGMMNSINMLDNMDGITASSSLVITLVCFFITLNQPEINPIYSSMLIAVAGSLIGFLFFNVSPAKMYMGDTGSMFLGVFLGGLSIDIIWSMETSYTGSFDAGQFLMPMMIFIVPIIDTLTVFIRRIARRQSPFVGGKDHTTHHLVYFGYSDKQVMYWFILANSIGGGIAYLIYINFDSIGLWLSLSILGLFLLIFFGTQRYYDIGKLKDNIKEQRKTIHIENAERLKKEQA